MNMEIGNLVRQQLWDDTYRYGIVTGLDAPEPVRQATGSGNPIEVYFTPTVSHPVAVKPYMVYVATELLELVSE